MYWNNFELLANVDHEKSLGFHKLIVAIKQLVQDQVLFIF